MDQALSQLRKRYGSVPLLRPVLPMADFSPVNGKRRAEVAMAIRRPTDAFLLQTKAFYPPATFRIPTGGIKKDEDVDHALLREVHEESNLTVEIERAIAVIDHTMPDGRAVFRTYLFLLRETGGLLKVNDPKERISGWSERDIAGLRSAISQLRALEGSWQHWGSFRAVPLGVLVDALD